MAGCVVAGCHCTSFKPDAHISPAPTKIGGPLALDWGEGAAVGVESQGNYARRYPIEGYELT
jgi:hypothetical protein